jgi:hypothetical protein
VAAPGTQVSGAPVTGALGEDGLPRKKRRRRRRRRGRAGAPVIDPLTGLPVPQQPGAAPLQGQGTADGDDDEGEEEGEEDEQTQRMDLAPAPSAPLQDQQGLVQAATHAILGTTPPPSDVVTVEVQPPTEVLDAADVAAHLDALDEADDEEDDEEEDGELAPLPPPGPPSGEGTASPEEPTVLAKRASRRPAPRGKPRAAAGAKGKKKAAVKKKAKPRS